MKIINVVRLFSSISLVISFANIVGYAIDNQQIVSFSPRGSGPLMAFGTAISLVCLSLAVLFSSLCFEKDRLMKKMNGAGR